MNADLTDPYETAAPLQPASAPVPAPAPVPANEIVAEPAYRSQPGILMRAFGVLASFHIACAVFALMLIVVFVGTWYQKEFGLYDCQRWYFESWITPKEAWIWGWLPLPGMALLLAVMFVNVLAGGIIRIRKSRRTIGVIISHFSILGFIAAGAVSLWTKTEGMMQVEEGKRSSIVTAAHDWVVEVRELTGTGKDGATQAAGNVDYFQETLFRDCEDGKTRRFFKSGWPFELQLGGYLRNARVVPASDPSLEGGAPRQGGYALKSEKTERENERNTPGVVVEVLDGSGKVSATGLLAARARQPFVFASGDRRFSVHMTRERWEVPFSVHLEDFRATYYPGTQKAKEYESDIKVIHAGGRESKHRISMNKPLRDSGYVAFQTDFDHDSPPGQEKYSIFTVVKNRSDQWPYISLFICLFGLALHFVLKLVGFLKRTGGTPAPTPPLPANP